MVMPEAPPAHAALVVMGAVVQPRGLASHADRRVTLVVVREWVLKT
jgi:hypothetical protein